MELVSFCPLRGAATAWILEGRIELRASVRATFALAEGVLEEADEPEDPMPRDAAWLSDPGDSRTLFRTASEVRAIQAGAIVRIHGGALHDEAAFSVIGRGARIDSKLPNIRPRLFLFERADLPARELEVSAHDLAIDSERKTAAVVWRAFGETGIDQPASRIVLVMEQGSERLTFDEVRARTRDLRDDLVAQRAVVARREPLARLGPTSTRAPVSPSPSVEDTVSLAGDELDHPTLPFSVPKIAPRAPAPVAPPVLSPVMPAPKEQRPSRSIGQILADGARAIHSPRVPAPTPPPDDAPANVHVGPTLDLIFVAEDAAAKLRKQRAWKPLLGVARSTNDDRDANKSGSRERRDIALAVQRGTSIAPSDVRTVLRDSVEEGIIVPKTVLVRGVLELRLEPVASLKALLATAALHQPDTPAIGDAMGRAEAWLGSPWIDAAPEGALVEKARLLESLRASLKPPGPSQIEAAAERAVVAQRAFATKPLLGDTMVLASVRQDASNGGEAASMRVYLPESALQSFPLVPRFPARILGDVMAPLEEDVACAFVVLAVARELDL
ncbi:MAG: hypothetical protein HOW73_17830 [Polyangiaceae bacterium]|nr:hypothetical protein [Polyangiaceae bacterium]